MFFEGSEKKAEIIIDSSAVSLLNDYNESFWRDMVAQCNAQILSIIKNDKVCAYLLSESSLFVWDDHLVILTCGDTRLVNAVEYFLQHVDRQHVKQVIYQRKNEYCSHLQATHVRDDTKKLQSIAQGKLLRFGDLDSHHSYLYHLDNDYQGDESDKTYEVLIYNIEHSIADRLTQPNVPATELRALLKLDQLIPGFEIDDHVFEPFGYSLNAIRGNDYFTIHLTPQKTNSYVSFESNLNLIEMIPTILQVFNPASFDVITYNEFEFGKAIARAVPSAYKAKELVEDTLSCCYKVNFATYYREQTQLTKPTSICLEGASHVF